MNSPIEPAADIRESAATMFQMFIAYTQAGFTVEQAMSLIQEIVRAQVIAANTTTEDDDS